MLEPAAIPVRRCSNPSCFTVPSLISSNWERYIVGTYVLNVNTAHILLALMFIYIILPRIKQFLSPFVLNASSLEDRKLPLERQWMILFDLLATWKFSVVKLT